jgi:Clostripain family
MKQVFNLVLLSLILLFLSCNDKSNLPGNETGIAVKKKWLFLVYMNADNDLETQGLKSLNEYEASLDDDIEMLVLVDRSEGYDSSEDNWTGTRLYRIKKDSGGMNYNLKSERIACSPLGLSDSGDDRELNLGLSSVLSSFVSFGKTNYPSDYTSLIIWGHGSGWKSDSATNSGRENYRAFSFDDTDNDFLHTAELSSALQSNKIDLIGFDTCSSALVEVAYQLRDCASWMVGSEDLIPADGWNNQDWLSKFIDTEMTVNNLLVSLKDSFSTQYSSQTGATFSVIDLSKIENVLSELNIFISTKDSAAVLSGDEDGYYNNLKTQMMDDVEDFYSTPGDLNIDIGDLAKEIDGDSSPLLAAVKTAVPYFFTSPTGNPEATGLAIHFVPLSTTGSTLNHDDSYFIDRFSAYPLDFVQDCSWAMTESTSDGFLYKLFY